MIYDQAHSLRSSAGGQARSATGAQPAIFDCPNTDDDLLSLYAHLKANRELLAGRGVRLLVPDGVGLAYANRLSGVIVKYLGLACQVART